MKRTDTWHVQTHLTPTKSILTPIRFYDLRHLPITCATHLLCVLPLLPPTLIHPTTPTWNQTADNSVSNVEMNGGLSNRKHYINGTVFSVGWGIINSTCTVFFNFVNKISFRTKDPAWDQTNSERATVTSVYQHIQGIFRKWSFYENCFVGGL